jgi:SAM-dependent methyltransferase
VERRTVSTEGQQMMGAAVRLSASVEAAGALAAYLRVVNANHDIDPQPRALLGDIAAQGLGAPLPVPDAAGGGSTGTPADPTPAAVVGMVRALLAQTVELVDNPGRRGSWDRVDPVVLQGLGRLSMAIADAVRSAEGALPGLAEALRGDDATILDVGAGTAWLAIAFARTYPQARVVGIDVFEPALRLARTNVADAGLGGRVELRHQDVVDLAAGEPVDLLWLPLPFLPRDIVPRALAAAARAVRPGGWVVGGTFAAAGDRLSELLADLRTVRAGGHPWRADDLLPLISAAGFTDVAEVPRRWTAPVRLFAGRKAP